MVAEIVCVGTELLLGDIVNTNAQHISKELAHIGIDLYYQTVVGDNKERVWNVLDTALKRSDLIIMTGGLGPTKMTLRKSSGYLFTQPTTGRLHTETSMKQMWRSFKQALDLDMGAQMVHGAIDPETSLWLMISHHTACDTLMRPTCSPPVSRLMLQRIFCVTSRLP